ncbi:hypothetical protein GZ212_12005 [Mangrovimonas sp. CR14]|uniref:hypothetical protein n=1 Tax=Mangrovimonas sp. CR14 TaxID=2706120 RepID=UPI0014237DBC|nr:hypothetical protein [Mangrovimonas sp. CR14]NIK92878.1 hypothetical protein [Mangrovimonas sp. CR14]
MPRPVLTLLALLIFCCTNKYDLNDDDIKNLNKIIDSMYLLDQGNRTRLYEIDSLYDVAPQTFMFVKNERILTERLGEKYVSYKNDIEQLMQEIQLVDHSNTQKLIDLTKTYGFPSNERLGVYKAKAYMIFVHAPREFFPEVSELISKEFNEGRINEYKMEYIFWHIKGREGFPPTSGENGKAIWRDLN